MIFVHSMQKLTIWEHLSLEFLGRTGSKMLWTFLWQVSGSNWKQFANGLWIPIVALLLAYGMLTGPRRLVESSWRQCFLNWCTVSAAEVIITIITERSAWHCAGTTAFILLQIGKMLQIDLKQLRKFGKRRCWPSRKEVCKFKINVDCTNSQQIYEHTTNWLATVSPRLQQVTHMCCPLVYQAQ